MKKVSTRAAAQSRNISQQKLTIGLDLGDRNCAARSLFLAICTMVDGMRLRSLREVPFAERHHLSQAQWKTARRFYITPAIPLF
ncbi:MAG TPA: hypothetical protein VH350_10595 [Candidatus Sulfotelmatobacter sp.]|jgi:hypothetical protein|nr:hypothetical protein [Candidatus Sulfotelmatobacter sp.]